MIITKEKYQDFLNGQCPPAEEAMIADCLQENPEQLNELLDLHDWQHFNYDVRLHPAVSEILQQNISTARQSQVQQPHWLFAKTRSIAALAASVIMIVAGFSLISTRPKQPKATASIVSDRLIKVKNQSGKPNTTILPDGSEAIMQSGTTISFSEYNNDISRDVYLEGTAYFSVKKDKHSPFNVHAGNTITTALGTSFTITQNQQVTIQLHEGKVVVRAKSGSENSETFLLPGETLTVKPDGSKQKEVTGIKHQSTSTQSTVTTQNVSLDFHQTPLSEVLDTLSKKFNTKISYINSEDINVTARFKDEEKLESILDIICTLNGLESENTAHGIIIKRANN